MVLTVSFVLSPVTMLGCHRHQWNRFHQLSACIGAPGPHDFAVRTNTARRAIIALGDVRPSHPIPNVRDDREPPLLWERDESKEATDLGVRSIAADRDRLARRANYADEACTFASHHRSSFRGDANGSARTRGPMTGSASSPESILTLNTWPNGFRARAFARPGMTTSAHSCDVPPRDVWRFPDRVLRD